MEKLVACSITTAALLFAAGCGTFSDIMCGPIYPDGPPVYGGVQMDLAVLKECGPRIASQDFANEEKWPKTRAGALATSLFFAADLPLSGLADTLLLPGVLQARKNWRANLRNEAENHSVKSDMGH